MALLSSFSSALPSSKEEIGGDLEEASKESSSLSPPNSTPIPRTGKMSHESKRQAVSDSTVEEVASPDRGAQESPPDGGWLAWLSVVGSHLVVLNTWGVINSFGMFQNYYVTSLGRSPSDISWIGSIEMFFLFFIGTLTGRLTDAGYFRSITIVGSVLVVAGTLTTSVCTTYWQVFLAQGVCVGLGNGCLFCPAVAVVSTYFQKRRSIAIGIVACGSVTGGIIFPVLVRELLPRLGFGWSVRIIGFLQAGLLAAAMVCIRPRIVPRKSGPIIEWAALKEIEYTSYALGSFLCFWGTYVAFFFVSTYSTAILDMPYGDSLNLLMVMSGVGVIGRILPNYFADRLGAITLLVPISGATALIMFCWIAVRSPTGLYVWAAGCGIAAGGIQALFPSALASLTKDPAKQGSRIGLGFTIVSFSVLTGPPIAGALVSALDGRYVAAQAFGGSSLVLGTLSMLVAREALRRKYSSRMWDHI